HPVLLVFFFTLCPHCLGELQTVRVVVAAHGDTPGGAGLVPLYINSPAERASIPDAYVTRVGIQAPVLLDGDGRVAARYGIYAYPTLVLVDARGIVRATWTGAASAADLDAAISHLGQQSQGSGLG